MKLFLGILSASILWFLMFAEFVGIGNLIHNNYFWQTMTVSAAGLSVFSLISQKDKFKELYKVNKKLILIGLVHAVLLYLLARFGVFIAGEFFDFVIPQIEAIYSTREQLNPIAIATLLIFIIGPAEEIFWRGFVQERFGKILDRKKALIVTTLIYSLVHIWALNPMLLFAALVLGFHWGFLYYKYNSLVPGIISHAIWDALIFVIIPINF